MRRIAVAAVALALGFAGAAQAHPGHGADAVTVEGDALRYSPAFLTVGVGDAVVWFWEGTASRNHSVTADAGQAEQFDSDPAGPPTNASHPAGSSFSHVFTNEGRFTYYCKNHASMRGTVEVVALPPAADPPRLSALRVSIDDGRATARFRLSRRAQVVGRIAERRGGGWRRVKSFYRRGSAGKNRIRLPGAALDEGRYRVSLVAYNLADRRSNEVRAQFTL
jgi:plastocyanin